MPSLPEPPQALAEVWDKGTFNDIDCPGLMSVSISRANKWDTKKAAGSHGGERQFKGSDLASVKIKVRLWTNDDYVAFNEQILSILDPDPGKKKADGIALGHAVAWSRNLRSITVDSVSGPESDNAGMVEYDIDATEYREPDKTNATGKASGGAKGDCTAIAAQLSLLLAQQAVDKALLSAALSGSISNPFDPNAVINDSSGSAVSQAEEIAARMAGRQVQIDSFEQQQIILGCNQAPPSGLTGQDQEAAQGIAA